MGRHLDDLDAVLESDALDDFRQLIFSLQSSPSFGGRGNELEHHELGNRRWYLSTWRIAPFGEVLAGSTPASIRRLQSNVVTQIPV